MGKDIEDELEKVKVENAVLLHELGHRVNNNLQLMESLVKLQMSALADPIAKEALRSTQRALHALCVSNGLFMDRLGSKGIDLASLMRSLTDKLAYSPDPASREVEISLSGEGLGIRAELVVPLGLVTGEILARALDRSRSRPGRIRIGISWTAGKAGELWLKYRDEGGRMEEEALRGLRESLGLMIAGAMAEGVYATLTIAGDGKGTTAIVGLSPLGPLHPEQDLRPE
jgi:two-component sensor histidine kinase